MIRSVPYFRVIAVALVSAVVLAVLLNLVLHDWVAALHLAVVITFEVITVALAVRALVVAVIKWVRRDPDDPSGYQRDFDLAA